MNEPAATDVAAERPDPDAGVDLTRKPTLASSAAAVGTGAVAALVAGFVSTMALAIGATGIVVLAVALAIGNRDAVDAGAFVVFAGVLIAGVQGGVAAVEPTLVGTIAAVLAWDRAHAAVDLGEQLGRETPTLRLEAVGFASSLLVGLLSGTVGYAVYVFGTGSQPVPALVLLLLAALFITIGLGSGKRERNWRSSRRD
ncbi:DUF7519 family protein [Natronobacterium gregoryi]|uniref:Uncharacterized protein n=2 Tax=Natronobacterium gregoryi TaxID=44930 RepID=L0AJT7_NATGS|nr:hypothetical protein [Natronobacterium gregoryi]AFZ73704.1 hypothetical protein Natgr_2547 [Natronobacterium gregoryi SP2]ELY67664.1 hypothetical protein C490_10857 [Natronobacterium gregoryi SP2]PLK19572.1 hypothetical protein CYV19_14150 [Natronobacterium gregoryi SP2]SFJ01592.1 hypothetical protein SAMN05443661_11181 [Natronobacterium gregoryi]